MDSAEVCNDQWAVVDSGGQWWAVVGSGGQWWAVVGSGGQWWAVVDSGGHAVSHRDRHSPCQEVATKTVAALGPNYRPPPQHRITGTAT
jgi:hypothetical protein